MGQEGVDLFSAKKGTWRLVGKGSDFCFDQKDLKIWLPEICV